MLHPGTWPFVRPRSWRWGCEDDNQHQRAESTKKEYWSRAIFYFPPVFRTMYSFLFSRVRRSKCFSRVVSTHVISYQSDLTAQGFDTATVVRVCGCARGTRGVYRQAVLEAGKKHKNGTSREVHQILEDSVSGGSPEPTGMHCCFVRSAAAAVYCCKGWCICQTAQKQTTKLHKAWGRAAGLAPSKDTHSNQHRAYCAYK